MTSSLRRLSHSGRVLKPGDLLPYLAPLQKWKRKARLLPGTAVKIGIAVSGGPDSMALAYLLKNIDSQSLGFSLSPTALIVDHSMRNGSDLEARKVMDWCQKLGVPAIIGTIVWRSQDQYRSKSEGSARIARYNELDRLLEKLGSPLLFLGHHQDDNVETIMMRMIKPNVPLTGLAGMRDCSPFPVYSDMGSRKRRGMRNAEPPLLLDEAFDMLTSLKPKGSKCADEAIDTMDEYPYADVDVPSAISGDSPVLDSLNGAIKVAKPGGVMVHRPLLAFTKQDLVETCKAYEIPHVHDPTNDDATFTVRNAVRRLRKDYSLPLALQHSRLLTTVSRASTALEVLHRRVASFLRFIPILKFDLRSGIASIKIPEVFADLCQIDRKAATLVLFRCSQLVDPGRGIGVRMERLFDKAKSADYLHSITDTSAKHGGQTPRTFTFHGVRFDLIETDTSKKLPRSRTWRLSRMLPSAAKRQLIAEDSTMSLDVGLDGQYESHSALWDNRYWIKLRSNCEILLQQVRIRMYSAFDAAQVRKRMSKAETAWFDKQLRESAPGDMRYTLPVLTVNDKIIAFPTLSTDPLPMSQFSQATADLGLQDALLDWSVIFKAIEISLPLSEWGSEVPPSREDFVSSWQNMTTTDTEATLATEDGDQTSS